MNRRTFIGSAATVLSVPLAARAQPQSGTMRRLGVLLSTSDIDPEGQARLASLRTCLLEFGWTEGRNISIDYRWGGGDPNRVRTQAADLVASKPDVIVASPSSVLAAVQRETRTIPVVFAQLVDPVGTGFVSSLAHPGGNITGFSAFEFAIGAKWLQLLKEIAPSVTRVAAVYDPATPVVTGLLPLIDAAGRSAGIDVFIHGVRDAAEIERVLTAFAAEPNGGLVAVPSRLIATSRDFVISLAHRLRLPDVSAFRYYSASGGLASYGVDNIALYRRAASYVDRILRGEKPENLPVQMPNRYELIINLRTAKALGIEVPATVLARADEVIE
jgi:putative tryptophan/tyrosine transport system substrate-binding protein